MTDNPLLDTIISLVVIYAFLSIITSILLEAYNNWIKERGVYLQRSIFHLLNDPLNHNFGYLIYQHPMIDSMRRDRHSHPHYIAPEIFSNALIDVIAELANIARYVQEGDSSYKLVRDGYDLPLKERFVKAVHQLRPSEFRRLMENLIDRHGGSHDLNITALKAELGRWYSDHMDRVSGQYKNDQRWKLRILGALVALGLNVDTIHLINVLYANDALRNRMVEQAEKIVTAHETHLNDTSATVAPHAITGSDRGGIAQAKEVVQMLKEWEIPMGWSQYAPPLSWFKRNDRSRVGPDHPLLPMDIQERMDPSTLNIIKWLFGIYITGLALSWGAPFWFETLVKLVNIRRSGIKPQRQEDGAHL